MGACDRRFWMRWAGVLAMTVAGAGLMACNDDDDDPATATVVVTNQVTGAVTTNAVAVPAGNNDAAAPGGEGAGHASVAGTWNGVFGSDEGQGHLDLELVQAADAVSGQFFLSRGAGGQAGNAAGTVTGDRLVVRLTVNGSAAWIKLDGHVNASSTAYEGNWTGSFGSGAFALQK